MSKNIMFELKHNPPPCISMFEVIAKQDKFDCLHITVDFPIAMAVNLSKIQPDQSPKLHCNINKDITCQDGNDKNHYYKVDDSLLKLLPIDPID